MRGAPCGLRPCKVRNLPKVRDCRERPMCRSESVGCYLTKGFVPPITAGEISEIQRHYVRTPNKMR